PPTRTADRPNRTPPRHSSKRFFRLSGRSAPMESRSRPSTFSIVAHDPSAGEWGIAVASKFLSVGAVVPWALAGVGAVATQSFANTTFGPAGLELLSQGYPAEAA